MSKSNASRDELRDGVSRRAFLQVGGLSVLGLSVAEQAAQAAARGAGRARSVIFLMMTGGPSQFETFDPKPDAPAEIRGPLKAIATAVPGMALSECLPRLAQRADRFSLIRSLHHDAAPIHETGLQLLQTGHLARGTLRHPHFGSVAAKELGPRGDVPASVMLPRPITSTGVNADRGQTAGPLGEEFEPVLDPGPSAVDAVVLNAATPYLDSLTEAPEQVRRTYGDTHFGRLCLRARQHVDAGVRCVTVNLFDTLADQVTWDCHGRAPWAPGTVYDYRDTLGPQFDRAVAALLDDLAASGRLSDTLVIATGEFGRTPHLNDHAGRDHWPGVWSALIAGAGVPGGQIIGASDATGSEPVDQPITAGQIPGMIGSLLGLESETHTAEPSVLSAAR